MNKLQKVSHVIDSFLEIITALLEPFKNPKHIPLYWNLVGATLIFLASYSVYGLFANKFGVGPMLAMLNVFGSVGILVILLAVVTTSKNNSEKGVAYMVMAVWITLVFGLVALNALQMSKDYTPPDNLVSIGRVAAMLLPALGLLPVIVVAIARRNDDKFRTASGAVAHYFGKLFMVVILLASTISNITFGLKTGLSGEMAVLLGIVLESMYLWAHFKSIAAGVRNDQFDIIIWTGMQTLAVGFLGFVAIETVTTAMGFNIKLLKDVQEAGKIIYASAIGLGMLLTLVSEALTRWIDWVTSEKGARIENKGAPSYASAKYVPTLGNVRNTPIFNATGHKQPVLVEDEENPK